jgi:hypothetical protein
VIEIVFVVVVVVVVVDVDGRERRMRDMVRRFVFAAAQDAHLANRL